MSVKTLNPGMDVDVYFFKTIILNIVRKYLSKFEFAGAENSRMGGLLESSGCNQEVGVHQRFCHEKRI